VGPDTFLHMQFEHNNKYQISLSPRDGALISVKDNTTYIEYVARDNSIQSTNIVFATIINNRAALYNFIYDTFQYSSKALVDYDTRDGCLIITINMEPYINKCDGLTICLYPSKTMTEVMNLCRAEISQYKSMIGHYESFRTSVMQLPSMAPDNSCPFGKYLLILFIDCAAGRARILHNGITLFDRESKFWAEQRICSRLIPVRCKYVMFGHDLPIESVQHANGRCISLIPENDGWINNIAITDIDIDRVWANVCSCHYDVS
jgi:hypothetical protein